MYYICLLIKQVTNYYKKELNIKIQGAGVGGCDILIAAANTTNPSVTDASDCWCLWGTLNYSFCAYYSGKLPAPLDNNSTKETSDGRCPVVTGESLLCSDLSTLGNCYKGAYNCIVDVSGACSCQIV